MVTAVRFAARDNVRRDRRCSHRREGKLAVQKSGVCSAETAWVYAAFVDFGSL